MYRYFLIGRNIFTNQIISKRSLFVILQWIKIKNFLFFISKTFHKKIYFFSISINKNPLSKCHGIQTDSRHQNRFNQEHNRIILLTHQTFNFIFCRSEINYLQMMLPDSPQNIVVVRATSPSVHYIPACLPSDTSSAILLTSPNHQQMTISTGQPLVHSLTQPVSESWCLTSVKVIKV